MQRFLRLRDFDWVLMALVFLLSALSVLEIYSATINTKFHGFESKQVLWLVGGTAAMLLLSFIDYHVLLDVIHWIYGFCIVSLLVVLVAGQKVLGARRWIRVGGIHFQPSEWVKLILIIAVARYFTSLAGRELDWKDMGKAFLLVGVPMALVLKQPDLGTALTYMPVLLIGLFLGGIGWKKALIIACAGLILIVPVWRAGLKPYQKARLDQLPLAGCGSAGLGLPDPAVSDRGRRRRRVGPGRGQRDADAGRFLAYSVHGLHFRRMERGARLRRCGVCPAVILLHTDAFDTKRSDSRGPLRHPADHGRRRSAHLSDSRQCGDGRGADARHRDTAAAHELWWIIGIVHVPRPGHRDECPDESVRELGTKLCGACRPASEAAPGRVLQEFKEAGQVDHRAGQDQE